jgi:tape measure domain-containing protein
MASQNIGSIHYELGLDTGKFDAASNQLNGRLKSLSSGFDTLSKIGTGAFIAVGAAVTAALVVNIDNAIKRIDTLNNFPKIMGNLGYATDESAAAIKKLEQGVKGLPTSLDGIATAMQNIAPSSNSLDEATNLTLALNNALLAGGQSMDIQSMAMTQFSQAISKGKPDMMEWRTLATAMPGQLDQISQSLGYGKGQWQQMAADVSSGKLSFDKVKEAIVQLNQDGLGQFPSFAEQAKNSSGGMQTAIANANTSITRGITDVINAFGSAGIANAITTFGTWIESGLSATSEAITAFITYLKENEFALWTFAGAAVGLGVALLVALAPAIWGVVSAIGAAVLAAAPFILAGAAIAGIAYLIYTNWSKIEPIVRPIINAFVQLYHELMNALAPAIDFVKRNWDNIVIVLKVVGGILLAFVAILVGTVLVALYVSIKVFVLVINVIKELYNYIKNLINNWVTGWRVLGAIASGFVNTIRNIISNIVNTIRSFISGFVNAGSEMVSGLLRGISNGAGAVINKVKEIVKNSLDAVKNFFGIKSPSKVMALQGNYIMQGLGVGIDKGAKAVVNSATDAITMIGNQLSAQQQIDMMVSAGSRGTMTAAGAGALGGQTAVNTYVYGDTILNGETDQRAYLDRLAQNFVKVSEGAAT